MPSERPPRFVIDGREYAELAERQIASRPDVFIREGDFMEPCQVIAGGKVIAGGRKLHLVYLPSGGMSLCVAATAEPVPSGAWAACEDVCRQYAGLARRFIGACPGRFTVEHKFTGWPKSGGNFINGFSMRIVITPDNVRHLSSAQDEPLCSWELKGKGGKTLRLLSVNGQPGREV